MKKYNIATLPGDGIGPEIVEASITVLNAAQSICGGFELDFQRYDVGNAQYLKTGEVISNKIYNECGIADAMFMGSIGLPKAGMDPVLDPSGTEVTGHLMFGLRFGYDLFAGVRPIKLFSGIQSSLYGHENIDFVIVRENCEGLFASYGGGNIVRDDCAFDTQVITKKGTEKVSKFCFELALKRNGRLTDGKRVVTCTHKANVFRSFAFMKRVFDDIANNYKDSVIADSAMIDALALWLVQTPENYDIILAENSHGDIISDMAAAFVGGMGMAPSGDIGFEHALFQPAHGTAPTIAGRNIANPTATILSGKMMLEWLSERNDDKALIAAADLIEKGIANAIKNGEKTCDIGGICSTSQFANEVIRQMKTIKI